MDGNGHDHADRGEDDTVGIGAGFITGPSVEEGGLVHVAINPVAVFKVVRDETVNRVKGGKESEKISVVFVCRHDIVMTGLAVAVVGLPRVLEGVSGGEREKRKGSTRVR